MRNGVFLFGGCDAEPLLQLVAVKKRIVPETVFPFFLKQDVPVSPSRSGNFLPVRKNKRDGQEVTASGRTYGHILFEEEGKNGFGYDPLFYSDKLQKGFGVASAEEKNAVSHRAKALAALSEKIKGMGL